MSREWRSLLNLKISVNIFSIEVIDSGGIQQRLFLYRIMLGVKKAYCFRAAWAGCLNFDSMVDIFYFKSFIRLFKIKYKYTKESVKVQEFK